MAYHDVPNKTIFSSHIQYLKSHYNIISIETLRESLLNDDVKLPNYSLLITFDDGYRNVLENGLPVLINNKISSCIFIITRYIDTTVNFWWKDVEVNGKVRGESSKEIRQTINALKKMTNKERIAILNKIPSTKRKQITSEELLYMKRNKMYIGSHTHNHPMLNNCSDDEIENELEVSKSLFDQWKIEGFEVFAYPNGDRTEKTDDILLKNHIKLAFLFDHRINATNISSMGISRIRTNAGMPLSELKVKASGLHSLISNLTLIRYGSI
ncbi:polysaccharide deacetylase family protein [Christiangramia portivictoriae]|uniref:polysaccharide deacetylase family protein n=1 Tax=Christiangramia portivictoriae TaxID=326069 RepID=UPI000557F283|nr:polysaccharide deacetylase family protein [Christiangramia portivictoriae]